MSSPKTLITALSLSKSPNIKYIAATLAVAVVVCASRADAQTLTTLVQFTGTSGTAIGFQPHGGLTLDCATLYGTTSSGDTGNIFSVGIDGSKYHDLYDFTGGAAGAHPEGDLTLSGGTLFGMTAFGGANEHGTLFALTLPTAPIPEPGTLAIVGAVAVAFVPYRWLRPRSRRESRRQAVRWRSEVAPS
jgi:uncharacterized repeat protein (TIGR03803 family)